MKSADVTAAPQLGELEFKRFQKLIYEVAGIHMSPSKRSMVAGRLAKRLRALGLADYVSYVRRVDQDPQERQWAVDLLTTNETYFFREPKHFEYIEHKMLPAIRRGQAFRVWSAACSSGEEPYSLAMLLAHKMPHGDWNITASDISTQVLARAAAGQYPMARAERISQEYLKRFCLRGVGSEAGTLLVDRSLRSRVSFCQLNLNEPLPSLGTFDLILLRNVLIYFNVETKQQVVARVVEKLKPGGIFMVGHSESLNGVMDGLKPVTPSVYQKL